MTLDACISKALQRPLVEEGWFARETRGAFSLTFDFEPAESER